MFSDDESNNDTAIPAQPLSPFAVAAAEGFRCGDAADAAGLAMVLTGMRHFRH